MVECGLLNLASCLPQMFFEYLEGILNAPLQPLLDLTNSLISSQVNISLFLRFWAIIIYMLSMFYAFLIVYSGFQFIVSGYNPAKRENAKEWLKNIIVMIILIQASFFIYDLVIQLASTITSATLSLVNTNFFTLTLNGGVNVALNIILFSVYIFVLLLTSLILVIRYVVVSIGVVLFPVAIFFYFIEPLRSYGLFILNFLGICIFITFLDAILLIGFSTLVSIPLFANIKIIVMIAAFGLIDIVTFLLMFFSIIKSGFNAGTKIASIATKVGAMVA